MHPSSGRLVKRYKTVIFVKEGDTYTRSDARTLANRKHVWILTVRDAGERYANMLANGGITLLQMNIERY